MIISITNGTLTSIQETLSPASNYALPSTISVSGATSNYNSTSGVVTLTNLTSTMSIVASGVASGVSNITIGTKTMVSGFIGDKEIEKIYLGNVTLFSKQPSGEITDLTGYTWVVNDTVDISSSFFTYNINFLNNNNTYNSISITSVSHNIFLTYDDTRVYYYNTTSGTSGWNDNVYKTIQITGGTDATNTDLIDWLKANGTLTRT